MPQLLFMILAKTRESTSVGNLKGILVCIENLLTSECPREKLIDCFETCIYQEDTLSEILEGLIDHPNNEIQGQALDVYQLYADTVDDDDLNFMEEWETKP